MAIPQWFWDAVEAPRHDDAVEVDEADVTYTRWEGPAGAPGLVVTKKETLSMPSSPH